MPATGTLWGLLLVPLWPLAAKLFGLYPRKGTIAPGADADIVVYDPNVTQTLGMHMQHMNVDYSAWEGHVVNGKVDTVLSRGSVIVENDAYVGKKGDGQFLKRGLSQYLI